jgi:hypothetical protein
MDTTFEPNEYQHLDFFIRKPQQRRPRERDIRKQIYYSLRFLLKVGWTSFESNIGNINHE